MNAKTYFSKVAFVLVSILLMFQFSLRSQTVTNGDFESWTAGNPDGWTINVISSSLTFTQASGLGVTGDALQILSQSNPGGYDGNFSTVVTGITPGSYYNLSVMVKGNDDMLKLRYFSMQWLDASDAQIGANIDENTFSPNTSNAWTAFELFTNPIQAPAGAAKLVVNFRAYNGVGYTAGSTTLWVDDLTVTEQIFIDPDRTAGDVTQTSDLVGGSLNFVFDAGTYVCDITQPIGENVPWVVANATYAPYSGNWIGVAIDFPAGFTGASDIVALNIDGVAQTGPFLSAEETAAGELWYYFEMDGASDVTHTLVVNWDGLNQYETEIFVINAIDLALQENPAIQQGIDNTDLTLTPATQTIMTTDNAVVNMTLDMPLYDADFPADMYGDVLFTFSNALPAGANILITQDATTVADYTATGGETSLWFFEDMSATLDRIPMTDFDDNTYNFVITFSNMSVQTTYNMTVSLIGDLMTGFTNPADWYVFASDNAEIIVSDVPLFTIPLYEGFESGFTYFGNQTGNQVNFTEVTSFVFAGTKAVQNAYGVSNNNKLVMLGPVNLSSVTNPILKFAQIAETEANYDHCYVEISLDGGTTWTILPASAYQGSGTYSVPTQNIPEGPCFTETAYSVWNSSDVVSNTWWRTEKFSLSAYIGQSSVMIRFRLKSDIYVQKTGWFLDAIQIYDELCSEPTAFATTNLWSDGATFAWTSTASLWNIEVGASGFAPGTGAATATFTGVSTNPYQVTGLSPATTYQAYIQANCGGANGVSFWTGPVTFTTLAACPTPTGVTATLVTSSGATISWTQPGTPNTWDLIYGPTGFNPALEGTLINNTTQNPYAITGLSANTAYQVYVRADCGASTSAWSSVVGFTTLCVSSPLTVTEGFNTSGTAVFPACWTQQTVTGSSNITFQTSGTYPTVSAPYEGTRMVYWNSDIITNGNRTRLVSLPIETTGNTSVDVEFRWYHSTDGGASSYQTEGVQVQYSLNGTNWINAGDFIKRYNATAGWNLKTVTLPGEAGNQSLIYVGFLFTSNAGYNCYLDAAVIKPGPTCLAPSNLAASSITYNSAVLNWTASTTNPSEGYELYYSTTSTAPTVGTTPTATVAAGTITYNLTGLNANTTYYVWIRSNCGAGDLSAWSSVVSFVTPCQEISALPWTENFDAMGSIGSSIVPGCWKIETPSGTPWASANTASNTYNNPNTTPNYITCYYSPTAVDKYLITPGIALTAGLSYDFSFKYVGDNYTGWTADVRYNTTQTGVGSTVLGSTFLVTATNSGNTYNTVSRTFVPSTSGIYYFMVRVNSNATPLYLGFDDFKLEPTPTCVVPSGLTISGITTSSATISWTASPSNPSEGYEIYYSTTSTAPTGATVPSATVAAGITTYNMTGLSANTMYYVWVRGNCGAGDYSSWQGYSSFYTGYCVPTGSTTYYLTNVTTTNGLTNISNPTGSSVGGYTNYSATHSCSQVPGSSINFTLNTNTGTHYFYIWIDWNNDLDFADAGEAIVATSSYSASYTGSYTIPALQPLGSYRMRVANSELGVITACGPATYGEYEDYTIHVVALPSCLAPTALVSSAVTSNSATISWTASSSNPGEGYELYYSTSATPPTSGTTPLASVAAGTVTCNLTGLSSSSMYYVWVRSNCGSGDYSNWAGAISFSTACAPVTSYPYLQSFGSTIPPCWSVSEGSTGASYHWAPTTADATYGSAAPQSGTHFMYLYVYLASTSFNPYYLKTGQFDLGATPKLLSYYYYLGASGYTTTPVPLTLQVSTDNGSTWTDLFVHTTANSTFASNGNGWYQNVVNLSAYVNTTATFRFKSNSNYGSGFCDQAIDEFAIYDVPACMNPTLVTASASSVTTGTVSWTASTSDPSEGYQVYYSTSSTAPTSGTTPSETVAAGITSLNLTGLTAGSTYYIWVRSDCGDSNLSPWAGPASLYLGYCTPSTVSVDDQGITNVTFGFTPNIVNNTTGNESGSGYYGNYSAMIGDLPAGITSTVSVTFNTLTYDYYTRVWIDFNNDLDFVDAGEQVYAGTSASTSPNTLAITFIIPESVSLGNHRMRIGAGDMTVPTPCMTGNSYMCFEDYTVNVTEPPACLPPANITASTVSDVYTNISWTAPSNLPSEGYEVYYSTSPAAPDGSTPASADIANTELSYQITGLTASTTYYVWMRSECSTGSYSDWSTVTTFTTTGCDVADVCAFTFNLTDSYGDGWNDNNIDIVQNGVIIQNLTLASGSSSTVNVSMCSGLPTQIVFHIGDYIGEVSFNIVAPWGETLYSGSGFTTASDNVAVFSWVTACSPPTCPNPSGTVALNITQNSAEINWAENGDATLWDIVYGLPGFNPLTEGTLVSDLTTTAYLIDGVLNASTTYQVYVRANCGAGDYSDWVGPYNFSTACGVITSLPWTENFDLMPSIGTSIVPTCWVATSGSGTPWASANAASNTYNDPFSAPNYITVNWSPTATDKYLVTPGFALTAGQSYDFSFKYVGDGYTGWTADVRYNTAQSGTGSTMLGTAFQASGTAAATSYSNIMRTFVAPTTGIYYFMVHVNNNITPYYLGFDNFRLELSPTCLPVSSVTASQVTNHVATVSWVANGAATTWNLVYGPNGFNPLTEGTLVEGITTTSYQITGLSPTTQYQVYVQGDCGAGDLSIWSDPVSFTTLVACPAIVSTSLTDATYESLTIEIDAAGTETEWNVVYGLHGFVVGEGTAIVVTENPFTISGLIPETEYDFYIQANCGADGNSTFSSVISYSTTELCPDVWAVTVTNITTEGAQVAWSHSSAQDTWNIEVGLPGFIPGTGAAVLTFTGVTENPYIITTGLTPETNYTAYVMADCGANGSSGWIGSATFTTFPTCLVPVSVTMSAVTSGSATVSWTEAGTATTWNVLYGPFGFNPLTEGTLVEGITSTSYIIEGLDDATQYSVYVQADCGGGDLSNWTTVTSFYTQCGIIDEFTWLEEFTVWSDITQCWDLTGGTRTVAQYGGTAVRANYWSWSSGNTAYLKTPLIDKSSLTNPKLEFYWSHSYSSSYPNDKLTVQVSDDNGATWTDVWMLTGAIFNSADGATNTTPGTYISSGVIDLSSFGNNIYVRFYFLSGWGPDVFINNVSIYNLVCDAPADLAVESVDNNSAIVSWTDVSGEGEADIIYGAVGFDPLTEGTVVDNVSNPYTLTNLNPETAYDVYVRSVCELAGESVWTGPVSFTTLADCPQPTNLNAVAGSPTTAVVSWNDNSGEGTADVLYGAQGFNPATQGTLVSNATNPYTITGLSPETTYDVYVHSVCALTGESLWTGPFTFTTPAVLNDEADILSYTFGAGVDYSPATIDNVAKTVHLYVVEGTSLNNLIATFTLSTGASAMVAAVPQVSGTTANNFATGPLTYVVTAEDGTTTSNWIVTVEVWVGIGQANQFAMQVLPNPNNGRFTLYINHTSDKCRYELTDVTGRILVSKQLEGKGQISENFDLNLAPGSYYLRVISGNKVKTQKLIIE